MGWMLLQAVEVQKDIVALRYQVAAVDTKITLHSNDAKDDAKSISGMHHTPGMRRCDGCHNGK